MRIKNCPTQEIGATFFKKSTDRHCKNPDGTKVSIQYWVKECKAADIEVFNIHETIECDKKFATTGNRWEWSFVDENFCDPCRFGILNYYITPWAEELSSIRHRKTDVAEEKYIWHNYAIPFGQYIGGHKPNYWE